MCVTITKPYNNLIIKLLQKIKLQKKQHENLTKPVVFTGVNGAFLPAAL